MYVCFWGSSHVNSKQNLLRNLVYNTRGKAMKLTWVIDQDESKILAKDSVMPRLQPQYPGSIVTSRSDERRECDLSPNPHECARPG